MEPVKNTYLFDSRMAMQAPNREWQNDTWVQKYMADKFLFPYIRDIFKGKIIFFSASNPKTL